MVTQGTRLFGATIRDNVSMLDPEVSLEQVELAAKRACIAQDIDALPLGYDTLFADGGGSLSGGQRQSLSLARALLHEPKVLVLDEATSSLDTVTEQRVQRELAALRCTRVVIAHRLSTLVDADRIAVLEGGRVIAVGPHVELLASCSVYARLVQAQAELGQRSHTGAPTRARGLRSCRLSGYDLYGGPCRSRPGQKDRALPPIVHSSPRLALVLALGVCGCKAYDTSLLSAHAKPRLDAGQGTGGSSMRDGGGSGGTGGTGAGGTDASPEACTPMAEACNRADDDCDGKIDEDAAAACQAIIVDADSDCVRVGAMSSCVLIKCHDGFEDCDGNPANGCEPYCACHDCTDAGTDADAGH